MIPTLLAFLALAACHPTSDSDTPPVAVPWTRTLPTLSSEIDRTRGLTPTRAIVHLHSPWSHDACDGDPQPDGSPNLACLNDLRRGLCETAVDVAFLTDHPAYAATVDFEKLFLAQPGDEWLDAAHTRSRLTCDDGHKVTWIAGIEDELMPVGLEAHVPGDAETRDSVYNGYDPTTLATEREAGGTVLTAHTEQRSLDDLRTLQDAGLIGTELFNLHAAFDPGIRSDFLGLEGFSWTNDLTPFTSPDGLAEPDLFVLTVLGEQAPSIALWDALLARGPMVGTAGTDAHQNVMPLALRDGERGDSFRRMLRWFSNVLLVADGESPESALRAGRSYVAFDILGIPDGFSFRLDTSSGVVEMGASGTGGTLVIDCPRPSARSPKGLQSPTVNANIYKNGVAWAQGCGSHPTDGSGVYRVRIDITPHHLRDFLGDAADRWDQSTPWVYSNAIRVSE